MAIADWFSWKQALIVQSVFYSLGLLQQFFYIGQLWFIINCFVLLLLLRATYSDNASFRLMAWYAYTFSIFTDILSLSVFGNWLSGGGIGTFVLVMAIFLLLPKPIFVFFLYQHLKSQGIDVRQGVKYDPLSEHIVNNNANNDNIRNEHYYGGPISNDQRFKQQSNLPNPTNNNVDFVSSNNAYSQPQQPQQPQQPPQQFTQNNNVQQSSNGYDVITPGNEYV